MCRVLGYLGPAIPLADLLIHPKNSLVNQSFDPDYHHLLQLGGSGFASWWKGSLEERRPLLYRSCKPAFYDDNLLALASKLKTNSLLAHIRATAYSTKSSLMDENCHPFLYPGFKLAMAHNGGLPGWREMLSDILGASRPSVVKHLTGSTDTEPLYCLLMSQFDDPTADLCAEEIIDGVSRFLRIIIDIKTRHGNNKPAKLKFFMADGNDLVVANIGLGYNLAQSVAPPWEELRLAAPGTRKFTLAGVIEPVWYATGRGFGAQDGEFGFDGTGGESVIMASEPLTKNEADWTQIPFQHVAFLKRTDTGCEVKVRELSPARG